ncbi:TonB-dependent receptor plug domain-containing protein [Paracoccus pacificus]|uniref:TonB-dependent receptor plug domain-containing protein n=1 Tax=Paracoccus pacificus TaxID=1463598 RepID=A0ABW4R9D0_9RHOB
MKRTYLSIPLVLLPAVLLPVAAMGQQGILPETAPPETVVLEEIIISGGLSPIAADAYGRANSVLTADQIQKHGFRTVREALEYVPGVAITGAGDSNTQIRIRGAEGNHTLVLIDGVRAAAGDSEYFLTGLETANIDRIEVLRGPQSVFYGADASAGVINIITRKGATGTHAGTAVEIGAGWGASAYASTRNERGGVDFSVSARDDQGYDYSGDPGGDKDGIRRRTLGLAADYLIADGVKLGFSARRVDEEYDYDGNSWTAQTADQYVIDSNDSAERDEFTGQIYLEAQTLNGRLSHRLSFDRTRFSLAQNGGDAAKSRTDSWKYRAIYGIDGPVDAANQTVSFGLERKRDENSVATDQRRRTNSVALEYRGSFDALDVQAGLRHDDNDVFKNATTWSLGLSYNVPNTGVRLHASAGKGVVNPSYTELFGGFGTIGNPDLRPEENRGFDLGVEAQFAGGRGLIDVTYFHDDLEDEITYTGVPLANGADYYNETGTSKRRGVEISGRYQATDDLALGASYTYLHARNNDGSVEVLRPRHELGLSADYSFAAGRGHLAGDLRYVSGNFDNQYFGTYGTKELPSYTVVNLAVGYDLNERARITARVTNLFDKEYSETWGYATRGRAAYLGLEARW